MSDMVVDAVKGLIARLRRKQNEKRLLISRYAWVTEMWYLASPRTGEA